MTPTIQKEVVVVGAGFTGLASARQYLLCAPDTDLLMLDDNASIGGVWARQRIYPSLRSNNMLGTFELPSFPMKSEVYGVKEGEHIPGMVVHRYLCDYADHFDLTRRLKLRNKVISAEKLADLSWLLEVEDTSGETASRYFVKCVKLILSTGLTSQPENIHYAGEQDFGAPIINCSKLSTTGVEMTKLTPTEEKTVTVLGGAKSSFDAVWMFAAAGFQVNWVMRKSGYGPTWMAPPYINIGPLRCWVEKLTTTRFLTWMSPCLWGGVDGFGWIWRALHETALGRAIVKTFWWKLSSDTLEQSGITKDKELRKLIPDANAMWYATSLAILNYETSFHDFITSGQVKIYKEDITRLSPKTIHLADGTALPSPAGFVTAAHWQWAPNLEFKPASIHSDLGIPSVHYSPEQKQFWHALDEDADKVIFDKLPVLINAPVKKHDAAHLNQPKTVDAASSEMEPYRLYRFIAPPGLTVAGDRSIAFLGYSATLIGRCKDEIGGIWAYAYLNDKLKIDTKEVHWIAALFGRWSKRRYPYGFGSRFPDFVFEQVPYFDLLLKDLGLPVNRKSSLYKEVFEPYGQADYRTIGEEWLAMQRK